MQVKMFYTNQYDNNIGLFCNINSKFHSIIIYLASTHLLQKKMRNAQSSTEYNNIQVVEENGDIYFQSLLWCVVCRIRCRNCTPEARCYHRQYKDPDPEKINHKKLKISV